MKDEMELWEREGGVKFLRRLGIRAGQKVLDFGAGVGHYSLPAARVVGDKGMVYALDKEQESLKQLEKKAVSLGLRNIKIIKSSGGAGISLKDESIDAALLYDILHYMRKAERKKVYAEFLRVLKPDALLSVYPKHVIGDHPLDEFRDMHLDDVRQEINDSGFVFKKKYCDTISHDDGLNKGCVLNFTNGVRALVFS